jgi:alpha-amylase/alpha-mannosidase (GH57 family)
MTRVAVLWHMHQPFYQDLVTGEHILPWVRLHALKDYWGMVAMLRDFPGVTVTFNLVPSMLVQLEAFARDEARDRHLDIGLKPAESLSDEERVFCLEQFFHAHRPRMIDPYPRYAELLAWRDANGDVRSRAAHLSIADCRDLQVWHKLVWIDPIYHERDERIRALLEKGRDFTEQDKATLRAVELELLRRVVPEYRDAAARGQIELSTSPFYHPILPLLCDTDIYLRTHPDSRMPRHRFAHPDDALEQITRAVSLHERLFERPPDGLWPSEGSVSDAMIPLVAQAGLRWIATDEEILARTIGARFTRDASGHVEQPDALYRPYLVGTAGQDVACGFRDHALSDLIGFTYASWSATHAADDFVRRLAEGGRRAARRDGGEEPTIFVILDGENAWEHYDGQGRPFLGALYERLSSHPELRTVSMSEACRGATHRLSSISPGSWINGDFYIWIGHGDDHRAWGQLADARHALESAGPGLAPAARDRAREELLIAEGSDWFWWYGDDHSSEHDMAFDELFRRHVQNVYRAMERDIPDELFVSNITTAAPRVQIHAPTGFIEPAIDGEVTSYFEWVGAGCVDVAGASGAMQQVSPTESGIGSIEFGFDLDHLFLRVTGADSAAMAGILKRDLTLSVNFLAPPGARVVVAPGDEAGSPPSVRVATTEAGRVPCAGARVAIGSVVELQVPFRCLGLRALDAVGFIVALNRGTAELGRYPNLRAIEFTVPDRTFVSANWTA